MSNVNFYSVCTGLLDTIVLMLEYYESITNLKSGLQRNKKVLIILVCVNTESTNSGGSGNQGGDG